MRSAFATALIVTLLHLASPSWAGRFDGVYEGEFLGEFTGRISIVVRGEEVQGEMSNKHGFSGTIAGKVDPETGRIACDLTGKFLFLKFNGIAAGALQGEGAQGEWAAQGMRKDKGTWYVVLAQR
ncbi:hypothetical protein NNJEOMEG_00434 [Fundidesulfovibrio magnetotacticus]|uniref:Uncharacterized protein n=1 Tax=Fundidesulfovibrio magnetotacticus TaxID=2730080 RepID=A0A6V8LR56_9BACT|nr:hypothetical protein [Fundidesulfovibrio magnetotacticus]GFK92609.1 hypothetical protein NNJEOMEG_00434 [Fundidesulfovibrio magnetotacticus]